MKIITLWQPHASLVALSEKKIETRGWSTDFRGEVAIHAALGGLSTVELEDMCRQKYFYAALKKYEPFHDTAHFLRQNVRKVLPFGQILAVGTLSDCLPTESVVCLPGVFDDYPELDTPQERAFGNYAPGRFGFVFDNVRQLKVPVPYKSRQGKLLDLDAATESLVRGQL